MKFYAVVFTVGSIGLFGSAALAVDRRDDVADQKYLDLGAQAQFGGVGQITLNFDSKTTYGSATFIGFGMDQAWILTAEHVLSGGYKDTSTFSIGGKSWKLGSEFTYSNDADLAVIPILGVKKGDILATPFLNSALAIPDDLSKRTIGYGVGYGKSGTGLAPGTVDDSKKRAFTNVIDGYNIDTYKNNGDVLQSFPGYVTDFDSGAAAKNTLDVKDNTSDKLAANQHSDKTQTDMEGQVDSGDSGGGLFVQQGKNWFLAGVISQKVSGAAYGAWSEYAALDKDGAAFVTRNTGIAAPEPAPMAAISLGLVVVLRRRRGVR